MKIGRRDFFQSAIVVCFLSIIFSGCDYQPTEKKFAHFEHNDYEFLESYRKISSDTVHFIRLLGNGADGILLQGSLSLDPTLPTYQAISSKEPFEVSGLALDSISKTLSNLGFTVDTGFSQEILLVQVVPDSAIDNLNALRFLTFRHHLESKFDGELSKSENGNWMAGDLGMGGANMLYAVTDWKKALFTIQNILAEEGVLEDALIARRIWLTEDDWTYEIVFPREYQGVFHSS
jgi:hypothetical protein